jgi:hypothetical protein
MHMPTPPLRASTISTLSSAAGAQAKEGLTPAPHVTPEVEANVRTLQSEGNPLPPASRKFFESRLRADFTQVRVNTGTRAQETVKFLGAKAFTVGQSISFGAGQYAPESNEGKHLLAHELTHVVQQESGVRRADTPVQRSATSEVLQRQPTPQQAKPEIKFRIDWLIPEGIPVETNEQVAAMARLAIASLQDDLGDVESATVKAQVREANLRGANVTDEQLVDTLSLQDATMPDGQGYEDGLKDKAGGGKDVENEEAPVRRPIPMRGQIQLEGIIRVLCMPGYEPPRLYIRNPAA